MRLCSLLVLAIFIPVASAHFAYVVPEGANGAGVTAGKGVPLEILPVREGGKIRFLVALKGMPLAKAEVSVLVPGEEKPKVVATDETGHTEFFEKAGQYGAQTKHAEAAAGEVDGKKYDEIRHYATLVVTAGK